MKIVKLQIENIKRLVAVEITPNGNLVEITGNNAQGKTSVLDALWWAMKGERVIQTDPIRHGEEKAMIRLDLGEIVITRLFSGKGDGSYTTSLKVEAADGSRFTSPQTMLDELLGNLTFDPLNFTKMKPQEQMEMLKTFVPGIDFEAIDAANEADFDARTEINREHKSLLAQAEAIEVPADAPDEVDLQAFDDRLQQAAIHNETIKSRKEARDTVETSIQDKIKQSTEKTQRAKDLRFDAAQLDEQTTALGEEINALQAKLNEADALPDVIDIEPIVAEKVAAIEGNNLFELAIKKANIIMQATGRKTDSDRLTKAIDDRKLATEKAIKETKMPVDELGFGEDCILFKGVPFNQASDAEQLKVSIRMAMVMNPRLKVLRVRDGSLLDDDSMKLLTEMADKEGYQVWVERVDGSGKIGFVIEDGRLANKE